MNFASKLDQAISEMDRRDFLKKTTRGAVSASTGGLDKLAGIAGKVVNSSPTSLPTQIRGVLWDLINHDEGYAGPVDQITDGFTPAQVKQYLSKIFRGEGSFDLELVNLVGAANSTSTLDKYTDGAFTKELKNYAAQHGDLALVKLSTQWGFDKIGVPEVAFAALGRIGEIIPSIGKMFPPAIFKAAASGGDARRALSYLDNHRVLPRETIKKEFDDIRNNQEEQARRKKEFDDARRPQPTEKYVPGPDHEIYGSAMHQPFESRLNRVFQLQ